MDLQHQGLDSEQAAVVWWVVVFTCTLRSLHSLFLRAVEWLLKFLVVLLTLLGRYSGKIFEIARAVPSTSEQNTSGSIYTSYFSKSTLPLLPLYKYEDCIEKRGTRMIVKYCAVWNTL